MKLKRLRQRQRQQREIRAMQQVKKQCPVDEFLKSGMSDKDLEKVLRTV